MKKLFSSISAVALVAIVLTGVPATSFAQTTTVSSSLQVQLNLIATLTAQVQALQQQLLALRQQQQTAMVQLVSTLQLGSQGDQVKILQALLAADASIYPEGLVTGFFGPATARAIKRFQQQNGLDQVGRVGPKTLGKLNEWLSEHPIGFESTSTSPSTASSTTASSGMAGKGNDNGDNEGEGHGRPCAIVPPGHLIAPGWLRKNGGVTPIVPQCQTLPPGIVNHGDEGESRHGTSTIPTITSVAATPATSTATVSWSTNVAANSQVLYGATSAYGSSTVPDVLFVTSHMQTLTGLTPSTTYHFQVKSVDNMSNATTSSDMTFTTNALPVVVLPLISGINSSAASTTANISWTTNVSTNGTVFYSTAAPVDTTSTSTPSVNTTTSTIHTLGLTGLTASTTYFYVIQSTDGSSNTVTSTQQMFTTTQ